MIAMLSCDQRNYNIAILILLLIFNLIKYNYKFLINLILKIKFILKNNFINKI